MATKPVKNGGITSGFGWRTDPFDITKKEFHPGIDIAPPKDGADPHPEILSVWKSQVYVVGTSATFGERVWVKLLDGPHKGLYMVYPHMQKINPQLKAGMIIEEGTLLGIMGSTGHSTGIHTHLEIRPSVEKPGNAVNPVEITQMYKA
jgi:murein DD-endopeptidase MepM/ murein hydrolase activator NlpD